MAGEKEVEYCLVVDRKALFGANDSYAFTGFRRAEDWDVDLEAVLKTHAQFLPRKTSPDYDVENDPRYKQIMPGGIFVYDDRIFTYTRIGGEQRLMGRNDIFISGHINPPDVEHSKSYWGAFETNLRREFAEEVEYKDDYQLKLLGYVNTDDTMVDKVHFGVVYLIQGHTPDIKVRETDILRGELKTVPQIEQLERPLESWQPHLFAEMKKYLGK
jgi:predicted NUDIX family phosphoesterase